MTGDQDDFFARLKGRMPAGWFGSASPILDALLNGIACLYSGVYSAYVYMRSQTRLQTSTDGWLDMAAADYFGPRGLPRMADESDAAYRLRIQMNIVRERGTRRAVERILTDLTGRAPVILEPARPADTGAYGGTDTLTLATSASITSTSKYRSSRTNLMKMSQNFGNADGWGYRSTVTSVQDNAAAAPDGTMTASRVSVDQSGYVYQNLMLVAGKSYTQSVYIKSPGSDASFYFQSFQQAGSQYFYPAQGRIGATSGIANNPTISSAGDGWYRISVTWVASASGSNNLGIGIETTSPASFLLWGAQLEYGDAMTDYVPTTDSAITSADYDWQGTRVLYPNPRTNLYPYSGTFGGNKQSSTINAFVQNAAPDGGAAVSVVPTTGNVIHYLNTSSFGNLQGIPVSFSVFAKANGYSFIRIDCYDNTNRGVYFDLSKGVVASVSNSGNLSVNGAITSAGNGWYRCSLSYVPNVSTSVQGNIWIVASNNQLGFAADGVSGVLLYGAQFETSATPTSYIETGALAVTRTDYAMSQDGTVDFAIAPAKGAVLTWSGSRQSVGQDGPVQVVDRLFGTGDGFTTRFSIAPKYGYAIGYGRAGAYGSLRMAYQAFVMAYRPTATGISYVQGYGTPPGGYTMPSRAVYSNLDDIASGVTDANINAAVASVLPAATIAWLRIAS